MMRRRNMLDRAAERVMDLDSPAYGDERERAMLMESSTFGLASGVYVGLLGAVVASIFGLVLLSVALLVMAGLPVMAVLWYARRRDVDLQELADKAGARSTMISVVVLGVAMVLTFAAMASMVFTGQPMLPTPSLQVTPGEGVLGGMIQGAVVGGMLGGLAAIVGGIRSFRGINRRSKARGR